MLKPTNRKKISYWITGKLLQDDTNDVRRPSHCTHDLPEDAHGRVYGIKEVPEEE
jgi:hypothetical protein